MSTYFWSFMAGAFTLVVLSWLIVIPSMRRHCVVMALLERAKMYQERAKRLIEEGKDEEAKTAYHECRILLTQVEELHKRGRKP
jgi:hypothetical protein